ncbi:MAG: c-type cytochrome biogenesis protein CcsB [Deltaproteobacteria bacterium]|nr:c-type cytochrome biogenesis protein CcsB [Deltaproteobacteria bacterium]MBW2072792.1 c-type cytochrome biogenesis protein CcsB [Deltaproteobacteria bacterium]
MSSSLLLSIVTFTYLLAALCYGAGWLFRFKMAARLAIWTAWAGLLLHTAGIILRWVESYQLGFGHAPFANFYESLVFGAWAVVLIYLLTEFRYRNYALGVFPLGVAFLAMAYASFSPSVESKIQPLIPALKSNWLIAHVITCFLGYAAFAVACGLGVLYLIKKSRAAPANPGPGVLQHLPSIQTLDELIYQNVVFGFLLLSVGIITGSVWANSAWGNYWSWDPKETWSLITWLVYAFMLHSRMVRGWHGRRMAWLAIIGFFCVLFTYFGVNFLLSGLHSYAR